MRIHAHDVIDVEVTEVKSESENHAPSASTVDRHRDYGLFLGVVSLFVFLYAITHCDFFSSCIAALVEMIVLLVISTSIRAPIRKGDSLDE